MKTVYASLFLLFGTIGAALWSPPAFAFQLNNCDVVRACAGGTCAWYLVCDELILQLA